jgi:hypothetical protein
MVNKVTEGENEVARVSHGQLNGLPPMQPQTDPSGCQLLEKRRK